MVVRRTHYILVGRRRDFSKFDVAYVVLRSPVAEPFEWQFALNSFAKYILDCLHSFAIFDLRRRTIRIATSFGIALASDQSP